MTYSMKTTTALIVFLTFIHMSSARAAEPAVAWWSFDADEGRKDAIIGHHELVPGVRGLALRSNEFETAIECEAASLPALTKGSFTVEAWIAPRAFPWNYCPIIEQRDKTNGFYFGINYQGQLRFQNEGFSVAEKAFILSRAAGNEAAELDVSIAASKDSPLVNPAFVVKNWGGDEVVVSLNGKAVPLGDACRVGFRETPTGKDLILWLKMTAESPTQITLRTSTK